MSDQVDEDILSLQLENSLTLTEDEDDLILEKRCSKSLYDEYGDIKKNLLDSIDALQSPIKATSFKSSDGDLRKKVLIRNLKTPNKELDKMDKSHEDVKTSKKEAVIEEVALLDNIEKHQVKADPLTIVLDDDEVIPKVNNDLNLSEILDRDYIVIDELVDISTPKKEDEEPQSDVIKVNEKPKKKSGLDVEYVSQDPLENADNNNPDWQLLQKLKTDEERYKAVRERWRNLIVPEPNKDLTCFTWCRTKLANHKNAGIKTGKDEKEYKPNEEGMYKGRKRTFSSSEVESPRRGRVRETSEKRIRTLSCARVYDEKIAALRRHASEECLKINNEQINALDELDKQYILEKRSLSNWSLTTGHSISTKLDKLDQFHYQQKRNIERSYDDLSFSVWEKQTSEIRTLEEASAEVLAFHRFYQGLDVNAPESMALTEEQVEEIDEINCMYETFLKIYEE